MSLDDAGFEDFGSNNEFSDFDDDVVDMFVENTGSVDAPSLANETTNVPIVKKQSQPTLGSNANFLAFLQSASQQNEKISTTRVGRRNDPIEPQADASSSKTTYSWGKFDPDKMPTRQDFRTIPSHRSKFLTIHVSLAKKSSRARKRMTEKELTFRPVINTAYFRYVISNVGHS